MKHIIVRVSKELHRKVKAETALRDSTISAVVRELLKGWLERRGENGQLEDIVQPNDLLR